MPTGDAAELRRPPPFRPHGATRRAEISPKRRWADRREVVIATPSVASSGVATQGSRRGTRSGRRALPSSPGSSPSASSPDQSGAVGVSRSVSISARSGASGGHGAAGEPRRSGQGRGKRAERLMAAPEGGKDGRGPAVGLSDLPGLAHEPAVEAQAFDAAPAQSRLDPRVERHRGRLVATRPEHALASSGGGDSENRRICLALHEVEPRPTLREPLLHRGDD